MFVHFTLCAIKVFSSLESLLYIFTVQWWLFHWTWTISIFLFICFCILYWYPYCYVCVCYTIQFFAILHIGILFNIYHVDRLLYHCIIVTHVFILIYVCVLHKFLYLVVLHLGNHCKHISFILFVIPLLSSSLNCIHKSGLQSRCLNRLSHAL